MQLFLSQGFQLSDPFQSRCVPKIPSVIRRYRSGNYVLSRSFVQDDHIIDLLSFSPQTQFHNDPLYKSGKIILQDKASCFPAVILAPPATDEVRVIGESGLTSCFRVS
jgi:hypothetical protein